MECKINVVSGWKDCTSSPTTLTVVTYERHNPQAKKGTTKPTPKSMKTEFQAVKTTFNPFNKNEEGYI
ncbi:hypothetical protein J5A56_02790 [Prevotella melaninogenica]|uniref:hypothetical protein n=1 Tax=Prevotella TaxID=838 RepID=UPI0003AD473E|nr:MULTISPECIES: hypothetical protein [Prevotella]ERJ80383.1 hypothetical protein HMPREF9148_00065 [Prevotella sp. F0091]QUB73313.1 hypothetical protein J5A56_02790 [Prevotella melaninogenica]